MIYPTESSLLLRCEEEKERESEGEKERRIEKENTDREERKRDSCGREGGRASEKKRRRERHWH